MKTALLVWLLLWNIIAFCLMGADKWKAGRLGRRIPEKVLFFAALVGGSLGALLGMNLFRHKTRHWSFKIGVPVILAVQVILALGVSYWSTFVR